MHPNNPHTASLDAEKAIWGLFFLLAGQKTEEKQRSREREGSNRMFSQKWDEKGEKQNLIMPRQQLHGKP